LSGCLDMVEGIFLIGYFPRSNLVVRNFNLYMGVV